MTTGTETRALSDNLAITQANVLDAKAPVTSARETAQDAEDILGIFEDIANRADDIEDTLNGLQKIAKLVGKIGALKTVADALREVLEDVENYVERFEAEARRIHNKIEPIEEKVEAGREKLEEFEEKFDSAHDGIGNVRDGVDQVADAIGIIADFDVSAAMRIDQVAVAPNQAVVAVNDFYTDTKAKANALVNAFDDETGIVSAVKSVQSTLSQIADSLEFIRKPLSVLSAVIKPIQWALDASDFVYNLVVRPVLDPILNALGVNKIFSQVSDFINSLLPDINILSDAEDFLEDAAGALDVALPTSFIGELTSPLEDFTNTIQIELLDPFDLNLNPPTSGADVLIGGPLADLIDATLGDDIITGGSGDDTLLGNLGKDILLGGAGNDSLDGGDGLEDAVVYGDALSRYFIERLDEVTSRLTVTHDSPRDPERAEGIDQVENTETLVFKDISLPVSALDDFIYASGPGLLLGDNDRNFIFGVDGGVDTLFGLGGDDYLAGRGGNDELVGGSGNDILDGGTGIDTLDGGSGADTASLVSETVAARVALDKSLLEAANLALLGTETDLLSEVENVLATDFGDRIYGADTQNYISGEAGNDTIHGMGGDDEIGGGLGNDSITGGNGNDTLLGGGGNDIFVGSSGDDFVNGGAGDVDVLAYDDDSVPLQSTDGTAFSVIVDMRNGTVQKLGPSGGLIGTDVFTGVEYVNGTDNNDVMYLANQTPGGFTSQLWGGDGDDTMYGLETVNAANQNIRIRGGNGNDEMHALGNVTVVGGDGDDTVFAADYNGTYDGEAGRDTLDFSGSGHAWQLRFNTSNSLSGDATALLFIGQATNATTGIAFDGFEDIIGSDFNDDIRGPSRFDALSLNLFGGDGDDTIEASSKGTVFGGGSLGSNGDSLYGGAGNDSLIADWARNQQLFGEDGDDVLNGNPGVLIDGATGNSHYTDSTLDGGAGDDRFEIGRGRQVVIGGEGIDTADYVSDSSEENVSVFIDLALGGEIDRNDPNEGLLAGGDSFTGVENIWGSNGGFDSLRGDDGANVILGHGGRDYVLGRGGDDVIFGHDGGDGLEGGAGDDFIHGGDGTDTIDGGDGIDTASYAAFVQHYDPFKRIVEKNLLPIEADLEAEFIRVIGSSGIGGDYVYNVENVIGSVQDDEILGSSVANVLNGGEGNDTIDGRDGNDLLVGGFGNDAMLGRDGDDTLMPGAGDDILVGGDGLDTADYSAAAMGITVDFTTGTVMEAYELDRPVWEDIEDPFSADAIATRSYVRNFQTFQITPRDIYEADPLNANSPDDLDQYVPNSYDRDTLDRDLGIDVVTDTVMSTDTFADIEHLVAGAGSDTAHLSAAADSFDGGAGIDTASYALADTAVALNLSDPGLSTGWAAGDALTNVEVFEGSAFADTLTGTAADLTLSGGAGNDFIAGGGGAEALNGDDGDDTVLGGQGNDTLNGNAGDDLVNGGNGADEVRGNQGNDKVFGGNGEDTIDGGVGNDTLVGGKGETSDTLFGGGGDDVVLGQEGEDVLYGGDGADRLSGGSQSDWLEAGSGDDTLLGGGGRDTLIGGSGDDELTGSGQADLFVFAGAFGQDTITDFAAGVAPEKIDLSGVAEITDWADLTANHLSEVNGNAVISDGLGNRVTLEGVSVASLIEDEFVFVGGPGTGAVPGGDLMLALAPATAPFEPGGTAAPGLSSTELAVDVSIDAADPWLLPEAGDGLWNLA